MQRQALAQSWMPCCCKEKSRCLVPPSLDRGLVKRQLCSEGPKLDMPAASPADLCPGPLRGSEALHQSFEPSAAVAPGKPQPKQGQLFQRTQCCDEYRPSRLTVGLLDFGRHGPPDSANFRARRTQAPLSACRTSASHCNPEFP